jgi:hypothetical protein
VQLLGLVLLRCARGGVVHEEGGGTDDGRECGGGEHIGGRECASIQNSGRKKRQLGSNGGKAAQVALHALQW